MRRPVPRATFACGIGGVLLMALAACSPGTDGQGSAPAASMSAPAVPSSARPTAAPAPAASAAPASTASSASSAEAKVPGEDEAILRVSAVVKKHRLTELTDACLLYMVDQADADSIDIDVREKHGAACGGDPATSPRLFSFKLERATGRLTTDALDPADPEFKPID